MKPTEELREIADSVELALVAPDHSDRLRAWLTRYGPLLDAAVGQSRANVVVRRPGDVVDTEFPATNEGLQAALDFAAKKEKS